MGCARVATRDTEIDGFADQRGRAGDGAPRRRQRRRGRVRRRRRARAGIARPTGTWPSAAASTAASARTSPASSSASRCGSGTAASPTTASSPARSSTTPPASARSTRFPMLLGALSRSTCSRDDLDRASTAAPARVGDRRAHRSRSPRPTPASRRGPTGRRSSSTRRRDRRDRSGCSACRRRCSPPAASSPTSSGSSRGGRTLARRYLAVEGHRALAANEDVLPPSVRRLVDRDRAPRVDTAEASLDAGAQPAGDRRRRRRSSARSTPAGCSRPLDRVRGRAAAGQRRGRGTRGPRTSPSSMTSRRGRRRRRSDTCSRARSAAGERSGGCSAGCCAPRRHRGGGGPPGADAPTHVAAGPARAGRRAAVSSPPPALDGIDGVAPRADATLPRVGRAPAALPARLVHGDRGRPARGRRRAPRPMPDGVALRRPLARLGIGLDPLPAPARRATTSTSTPPSRRGSTRWPGRRTTTTFYVESLRRRRDLAVLVLLDVSGLGRRARAPAARRCTSTSGRRPPRSPPRCTTSATGSRSTPSTRGAGRRCSCCGSRRFDDHLDGRRGPAAGRPRPRRLHAARRRHPPRHRRSSRSAAGRRGGCSSCCPTASPTTTATRAATARPTPGGRSSRPAAAASGCLCLSVGADADAGRAAAGVRRRRPRHGAAAPSSCRGSIGPLFRAAPALGGGAAARVPAQGAHAGAPRGREEDAMTAAGTAVLRAGR